MEQFFGVAGAVLVVLLVLAFTAGVFAVMLEVFGKLIDRWRQDVIYRRDAEIGEILKSGAHYMSEEPEIERLLRWLGNHVQGGHSMYAGHWRDGWVRAESCLREARKHVCHCGAGLGHATAADCARAQANTK